jgi:CDP-diacylglycerol--glycerol-3-phosphate 3-phosphatidyltransferase
VTIPFPKTSPFAATLSAPREPDQASLTQGMRHTGFAIAVSSALIAFIELSRIPCWIVIVIIAREFIISGFRLVAADNGVVIAAGIWGKIKTAEQMVMICIMLADFGSIFPDLSEGIYIFEDVLIYAALILTIISLIDYLVHNKNVLS